MNITLHQTKTPRHYLVKTFEGDGIALQGTLREDSSMISPVIMIDSSVNIYNANYAYIEDFGRYYYIDDIKVTRHRLYQLSLSVDALMSWCNEIVNIKGYIMRKENPAYDYIPDRLKQISAVRDIQPYLVPEGSNTFNGQSLVMIVAGNSYNNV